MRRGILSGLALATILALVATRGEGPALVIERVSTAVPYPRGLALADGKLYVLARGRAREAGGVDPRLDDRAGTIFEVDPAIAEPLAAGPSEAVRKNGKAFAEPTSPPFRLLDRSLADPTQDRATDRPYCTLRHDAATRSFYVCAFSGIDKAGGGFSKNASDALLRYDLRTRRWHEVERGGWLEGPDNCLVVGPWLYAVAKDNSRLVRYDLGPVAADPEARPEGRLVLGDRFAVRGRGTEQHLGHSALARHGRHLYVAFRTSSTIVRIALDDAGLPVEPVVAELVARFEPFDPRTGRSANLTDMAFDSKGRLHVISAAPARVYRFSPSDGVFDGTRERPWADLAALTGNPRMKSENVLVDERDRVYVTSGDAYGADPIGGAIYRVRES